ncbi:MAG: 4-hydroxy-tetrahydrodipicolinate reductase [Myxococcaceae bacterium]
MAALTLLVSGVPGRMGSAVVRAASEEPAVKVVGAVARPGTASRGRDVGTLSGVPALHLPLRDDFTAALAEVRPDVAVDFTTPEAATDFAEACVRQNIPFVTGTTGFTVVQRERLDRAAARIPMVISPNMSVGVHVMLEAASLLARVLGSGWDAEVLELHHRLKKDAPSGTALRIAEVVAKARGQDASAFRLARAGPVGERQVGEIGVQTLRGGDVVGEHTAFFLAPGERIEISHRATSRDQFAKGALRAALWVRGQPPGQYGMRDVLGL